MANQSQSSMSDDNSIPTFEESARYIANNRATLHEKVLDKVATIQARKFISQTQPKHQDTQKIDRLQTKPKTVQHVPLQPAGHLVTESIDYLIKNQPKQWTLRAFVVDKTYQKPTKDDNRVCFTMDIVDRHQTIIEVIGYGEECAKWYDKIVSLQDYLISNGDIRKNNDSLWDHSIVLNESSNFVMLCPETQSQSEKVNQSGAAESTPKTSGSETVPSSTQTNHPITQSIKYLIQNQPKQWTLRAFVIEKSQRKPTEDEKRFCFRLVILDGCRQLIRVIARGEECDKWFDKIVPCQEYLISNGDICQTKFDPSCRKYEIILNKSSDFVKLQKLSETSETGSSTAPKTEIKMVPNSSDLSLEKLLTATPGARLDLIGIVHEILPKSQKYFKCCYLVDQSRIKVRLQISQCLRKCYPDRVFLPKVGQVVCVRQVGIGKYPSVVTISSKKRAKVETNPNIPETQQLEEWYQNGGQSETFDRAYYRKQKMKTKSDNKI